MYNSFFCQSRMHQSLSRDLIQRVIRKFHYEPTKEEELLSVAMEIHNCIKNQEAMELIVASNHVDVAISLGLNLDILLDNYSRRQLVEKQLMAENIISEIMLEGYREALQKAEEISEKYVVGMYFWGADVAHPLEQMDSVIARLQTLKIKKDRLTNMKPSKSVVFRFELSDLKLEKPLVMLPCAYCELGKSGACDYGK